MKAFAQVPSPLRERISPTLETWQKLVHFLKNRIPPGELNRERRIESLYVPIAIWISEISSEFSSKLVSGQSKRPLVLGIHGQQGCGKSTLTHTLVELLTQLGLRAVTLSIDDFYLTHREQSELAARFPDNPYLQKRGYPGTHDLTLGERTLQLLTELHGPDSFTRSVACPVYDKSAYHGDGDRRPREEWRETSGPLDVILLEGWMLGFSPVIPTQLPNPNFEPINSFLVQYDRWRHFLDAFLHLDSAHLEFVREWRIEAEEKMKARGLDGMTEEQVRRYIETFLAAYETYLPQLRLTPPQTPIPALLLKIGRDRLPTEE